MSQISVIDLEQQLTLRINNELSKQLDDIIEKMQAIAKKFDIKQVKERSPIKNVLTTATDPTSSLEVIKNFIRYQASRKDASQIWKLEINENQQKERFPNAVIKQIDDLTININNIFKSINMSIDKELKPFLSEDGKNSMNPNLSQNQREKLEALKLYIENNKSLLAKSIHLKLAQLYLGYLSREHTALIGS
ncbi:hypothetical protein FNW02_07255 [Komarekiella sp. 'clone 1']|uniref:Uncharacterized protein n=1 Tax=Komarekiella delphini-convector SJRDD-AB1 TaxID=2593771 RepID=A0AA40SVB4_9NOST|nr:hypothetical protein [Komarekiella delphini-convector]MBD6615637.1 hypothetical protein [Komarekiella delphini-convector SJRDD-AB1]